MTTNEVREKYLNFFASKMHSIIPSASIVPENDPTTLFTGSGMQPLIPYLLGESHPKGTRLVNSQKAFRTDDIDEVGDNRHTTFFEMLGNWSLGDYFKSEQLPWIFEFLTEELDIDPKKLYVTVFNGAEELNIPRDDESIKIWKKLFTGSGVKAELSIVGSENDGYKKGMKENERIFAYDSSKNWWSRSGIPANMPDGEPGGPDSEIFYDFGTEHDKSFGEYCHPNCDCGRFMEIGNNVFMEYLKQKDGSFSKLKQKNVDFGGGLERMTAATNNESDIFLAVDSLANTIRHLETASGKKYEEDLKSFRIIADHLRGVIFMISAGIHPGNTEQGYFVRRLIRRSIVRLNKLIPDFALAALAPAVINSYKEKYPELEAQKDEIENQITLEETKFTVTLKRGLKKLEKVMLTHSGMVGEQKDFKQTLPASEIFEIITSDGFPREIVAEITSQKGIKVDWKEVDGLLLEHQAKSRSGAGQKFKGGLADSSEKTMQLHTTHHLLLKALQIVLGDAVKQKGSNITAERLRIDFSYNEKLTDEQKKEIEEIVNKKIQEKIPVIKTILPKEEAEKLGAEQEFGQKYPDMVNVYSIGELDDAFSIEFCGGPHVENTSEIDGVFKIVKEKASSAGVRRIKGVLE